MDPSDVNAIANSACFPIILCARTRNMIFKGSLLYDLNDVFGPPYKALLNLGMFQRNLPFTLCHSRESFHSSI